MRVVHVARIRTVKPEFWSDEKLAECSRDARLLFIGTWNFADDEGRMEYSPKRLKMQIFPGDTIDVAPLVTELAHAGLVILYRVAERDYLQIPHFRKLLLRLGRNILRLFAERSWSHL
jgi:hypothetical protein